MRVPVSLLFLGICGCSGGPTGPQPVPVTGVVTFEGKPLTDATVSFWPEDTKGGGTAKSRTDANGNYKLKYSKGGEGAPPGKYKVTLSKLTEIASKKPDMPPPPGLTEEDSPGIGKQILPDRLFSPLLTKIIVTVPEKGGTLDIEAK